MHDYWWSDILIVSFILQDHRPWSIYSSNISRQSAKLVPSSAIRMLPNEQVSLFIILIIIIIFPFGHGNFHNLYFYVGKLATDWLAYFRYKRALSLLMELWPFQFGAPFRPKPEFANNRWVFNLNRLHLIIHCLNKFLVYDNLI